MFTHLVIQGRLYADINQRERADVMLLIFRLCHSCMCASFVFGLFLHISQQLKLAILKTTETSVVYYLFISFSCSLMRLFIQPSGFF